MIADFRLWPSKFTSHHTNNTISKEVGCFPILNDDKEIR